MNYYYFDLFVIPFLLGAAVMLVAIVAKWSVWLLHLSREEQLSIRRGIFTRRTFEAMGEIFRESLLHCRIWRRNRALGYMHSSLALGWFLLIVVGWIEAAVILGRGTPLYAHVFFRFFDPSAGGGTRILSHTMDFLLLVVLSGVALAWIKRIRKSLFGLRRRNSRPIVDRVAMLSLWLIFPLRLLAESSMSAVKHNGGFLTAPIGDFLDKALTVRALVSLNEVAWWSYSIVLGLFFVALPFSRYSHIFTEIPLIFLRRYGVASRSDKRSSYDRFQTESCSQCGICVEECALDRPASSMSFLRSLRGDVLPQNLADNCQMCGRCSAACPVGIETETLRLQARASRRNNFRRGRYDYIVNSEGEVGVGSVGYFIGCQGAFSPATTLAMERIFAAVGERVWWADRGGGVCCGRPLKLSGQIEAARQLQLYNAWRFRTSCIRTLVTACPICLRTFREDYRLEGIRVIHHTEYVAELLRGRRMVVAPDRSRRVVYHDPCELGRGAGIYDAPREVIRAVAALVEPPHSRADALCCGESLADLGSSPTEKNILTRRVVAELEACRADTIVTACPLCEKSFARQTDRPVCDAIVLASERMLQTNKPYFFAQTEILTTFVPQ